MREVKNLDSRTEYKRDLGIRIKKASERVGGQSMLSRRSGIPMRSLTNYISGQNQPKPDVLEQIATLCEVPLKWLTTGEGDIPRPLSEQLAAAEKQYDERQRKHPTKTKSEITKSSKKPHGMSDLAQAGYEEESGTFRGLAMLPVLNVQASAGAGRAVFDVRTLGFVGFDAAYLRSLRLTISDLFTTQGIGESMEPTIKSGEFMLCSKSEHHVQPGDGIYVIRLEGDILVKRLQRLPGKKMKVSSDNSAVYEPYVVELNDGTDFVILGKVLFVHGLRRV